MAHVESMKTYVEAAQQTKCCPLCERVFLSEDEFDNFMRDLNKDPEAMQREYK